MPKPRKNFSGLLFGTAGIPRSTPKPTTTRGIEWVKKLKLDAMELEFVRRINISEDKAPEIKEAAEKNGVILTCHAPYYINLNAKEKEKVEASMERIYQSAKILYLCGGWSCCFHAAYYMDQPSEAVFVKVRERIKQVVERLEDEGISVWIRPETTGKRTQFGSLDEILALSEEFELVMPVVDFAHYHARTGGGYNSYDDFCKILSKIEDSLGREGLENMHIHVSGIEYTDAGEREHLNLKDSDLKYEELLKALRDFRVEGVIISESPNIEDDALLMKSIYYELLGKKFEAPSPGDLRKEWEREEKERKEARKRERRKEKEEKAREEEKERKRTRRRKGKRS